MVQCGVPDTVTSAEVDCFAYLKTSCRQDENAIKEGCILQTALTYAHTFISVHVSFQHNAFPRLFKFDPRNIQELTGVHVDKVIDVCRPLKFT